ncbi:MAG: hypothetical protein ACKERF_02120 [Candidatus Hodgkinia cicadicola]
MRRPNPLKRGAESKGKWTSEVVLERRALMAKWSKIARFLSWETRTWSGTAVTLAKTS